LTIGGHPVGHSTLTPVIGTLLRQIPDLKVVFVGPEQLTIDDRTMSCLAGYSPQIEKVNNLGELEDPGTVLYWARFNEERVPKRYQEIKGSLRQFCELNLDEIHRLSRRAGPHGEPLRVFYPTPLKPIETPTTFDLKIASGFHPRGKGHPVTNAAVMHFLVKS
jgi:hypothetical protein